MIVFLGVNGFKCNLDDSLDLNAKLNCLRLCYYADDLSLLSSSKEDQTYKNVLISCQITVNF